MVEEVDELPLTREEGAQKWKMEMELRFLKGEDGDFDYGEVDVNEVYDDHRTAERDAEERWFDEEEPQWTYKGKEADDGQSPGKTSDLVGQTGVQDF